MILISTEIRNKFFFRYKTGSLPDDRFQRSPIKVLVKRYN